MATYRLPAELGGIEVREAGKRGDGRLILVPVAPELAEMDWEFCLDRGALTEVKSPEPPNGTVISDGAQAWIRCDDENGAGALWFLTGNKQARTWEEMLPGILESHWKQYVPDPADSAPGLPWTLGDHEDRIAVTDNKLVWIFLKPEYHSPEEAELRAAAILRAAREARSS